VLENLAGTRETVSVVATRNLQIEHRMGFSLIRMMAFNCNITHPLSRTLTPYIVRFLPHATSTTLQFDLVDICKSPGKHHTTPTTYNSWIQRAFGSPRCLSLSMFTRRFTVLLVLVLALLFTSEAYFFNRDPKWLERQRLQTPQQRPRQPFATPEGPHKAKPLPFGKAVLRLNESNFDEMIAKHDRIMVIITLNSCAHCRKYAPEFAKACARVSRHGFVCAQVEAENNYGLASRLPAQSFPTVYHIIKGEPIPYLGNRNTDVLVNYTLTNKDSFVREIAVADTDEIKALEASSLQDYEKGLLKPRADELPGEYPLSSYAQAIVGDYLTDPKYNFLLLGVFKEGSSHPDLQFFEKFAPHATQYGKNVRIRAGVPTQLFCLPPDSEGIVAVRYVPDLDSACIPFEASHPRDAEGYEQWIRKHATPPVFYLELNPQNYPQWFDLYMFRFKWFTSIKNVTSERLAQIKADLRRLGLKYYGEMYTILANVDDESENPRMSQSAWYGYRGKDVGGLESLATKKRYGIEDPTYEKVVDHIEKFRAGTLPPYFRSEPVPENPLTEGGYYTAVAYTLSDYVDGNNNVFLMLYAPWCGHSKMALEELPKLTARIKDEDVKVVIMDATKNEWDKKKYRMPGYPGIFFKAANSDELISFDKPYNRTAEAFEEFIREALEKSRIEVRREL